MNSPASNCQIIAPTLLAPPSAYFSKLIQCDRIVIDLHETWQKQTLRNRYFIGGPNHTQMLVVPVHKPDGHRTTTSNVIIDYSTGWPDYHRKALITSYSKSPFFLFYADYIFAEFNRKHVRLTDLNFAINLLILKWLNISLKPIFSSGYISDSKVETDLRNTFRNADSWQIQTPYYQVFLEKFGFRSNLSVFDILFNLGPEAASHLKKESIHE